MEEQEDEWLIDSACSLLMIGRIEFLQYFRHVNDGGYVTFGNYEYGTIMGYGVHTNVKFTIKRVAYVKG